MADLSNSNAPQFIGIDKFKTEYTTYGERKYTGGENGLRAIENRDIDRARQAVEAQDRQFGILLKKKIEELAVPARVRQELKEVAVKMFSKPFEEWLDSFAAEEYQIVFDEKAYNSKFGELAKQTYYTKKALEKAAEEEDLGQNFYASF